MGESVLYKKIQLLASKVGARLFRNNVGLFLTQDGRKVRTGLCVGSSDLIGWKSIVVDQSMVGKTVAVFMAVEIKNEKGKYSDTQNAFIDTVSNHGGIAIRVKSEEDFHAGLRAVSSYK